MATGRGDLFDEREVPLQVRVGRPLLLVGLIPSRAQRASVGGIGEQSIQGRLQLLLSRVDQPATGLLDQRRYPAEVARNHRGMLAESLHNDQGRSLPAVGLRKAGLKIKRRIHHRDRLSVEGLQPRARLLTQEPDLWASSSQFAQRRFLTPCACDPELHSAIAPEERDERVHAFKLLQASDEETITLLPRPALRWSGGGGGGRC